MHGQEHLEKRINSTLESGAALVKAAKGSPADGATLPLRGNVVGDKSANPPQSFGNQAERVDSTFAITRAGLNKARELGWIV